MTKPLCTAVKMGDTGVLMCCRPRGHTNDHNYVIERPQLPPRSIGGMLVICPYCYRSAELVGGAKIYPHRPELFGFWMWHCPTDNAWVTCHKGGDGMVPMGRLANAALRRGKMMAHKAFDSLWRDGGMFRNDAYTWLARELKLHQDDCHIGMFDEHQCAAVVAAVKRFRGPR